MERLNVHLTDSQIAHLKIICDESGSVRSELIRRAIDDFINIYVKSHDSGITGILKINHKEDV
jgi:metal-responsive CopG/Arc/MetJ family transcriptional regulator